MEAEAINKAVIMMKKWLSVDNHNELCVMLDTTMITENPNISPRWTGETLNARKTRVPMNHKKSPSPTTPSSK